MVLRKLKLKNFRGYRNFEVNFDDCWISMILIHE